MLRAWVRTFTTRVDHTSKPEALTCRSRSRPSSSSVPSRGCSTSASTPRRCGPSRGCLVVWRKHGRALRAGGYGFWRFWRETWIETADALVRCDPASYGGVFADAIEVQPTSSPATLRA
jgi:hypothetical protein